MNPTLYDILGVSPDASREEIRTAWREAADRFEPGQGAATKQFRLFNQAAEVLLDPERRKEYDDGLAAGAGATPRSAATAGVEDAPGPTTPPTPKPEARAERETEPVAEPRPAARQPMSARIARLTSSASRLSRGWVVALVVVGLLAAASVALGAYYGTRGLQAMDSAGDAEERQEALDRAPAAAENAAAVILSYNHESLEADRDAAAKFLTEDYRSQYVDTFDKLVVESATQTKAKVEAEVLASATMDSADSTGDRVPVLLFANQTTTSTANSGRPSVALNRVRFDMVEVDGTWLVDGITSY